MRRAVIGNSDQLVYVDGGGCIVVIGLLFSVAGIIGFVVGLTGPITIGRGESAGMMGTILCTLLGALFALFGVAIMLSRSGLTLDRNARTANRWWGVWRPGGDSSAGDGVPANVRVVSRSGPRAIDGGTEVTIGREAQKLPNKDTEQITYPVRLNCQPAFTLAECTEELEARHLAEEVAGFLRLAIVDTSSGTAVRREVDMLGQPLTEQVKQLGLPASLPPAPDEMRLSHELNEGRLTFTAPRERLDPFLLVYLIAPVLMSLALYYLIYRGQALDSLAPEQRPPVIRGMVLVLGLPLVVGLIGFCGAVYWGGRLTISTEGIAVRTRGRLLASTFLPVKELDEVRVAKANNVWRVSIGGFSVRSDPDAEILEMQLVGKQRIAHFGRGRSRAELEWVRDVILKAIAN